MKQDMLIMNKLENLYEPIEIFSKKGMTELRPDLEQLTDAWQQDYIMYRKRNILNFH